MIIINNDEKIIEERHVSFSVDKGPDSNEISLSEIVIRMYYHPQSEEFTLSDIETKRLKTVKENSIDAAPLILFKAAHDNLMLYLKTNS